MTSENLNRCQPSTPTSKVQVFFLLVCVFASSLVLAETAEAPLHAKAHDAVEKGIAAAKQAQWDVAIRFFNEGRQAAPDSAVPLLNLGLAEAQLAGHELRAICWFEAYLAAVPDAANAPAVRQQIASLKLKVSNNVARVIEMLKVLETHIPAGESTKGYASSQIVGLLTANGNLDAAQKSVLQLSETDRDSARGEMIAALAAAGRIPEAIQVLAQMSPNSYWKQNAYKAICEAQIAAGLFADAKILIKELEERDQIEVQLVLAEAEYNAGQRGDAGAVLTNVRGLIEKISDVDRRESSLPGLAETEYRIGLHDEADALFQQVKSYTDGLTGKNKDSRRVYQLYFLIASQNKIGRRTVALSLLKEAEKSCAIAEKAKEESVTIFRPGYSIWLLNLYTLEDYKGADHWLRYAYDEEDRRRKAAELADYRNESAARAVVQASKLAQIASQKTLADPVSSRAQRARAWSNYLQAAFDGPLYTSDFNVTLKQVADFVPHPDDPSALQTIFDHVKKPAQNLVDSLNSISALEQTH
jgi:hypothetical protein